MEISRINFNRTSTFYLRSKSRGIKYSILATERKREVSVTEGVAAFRSLAPISWISWNIQADVSPAGCGLGVNRSHSYFRVASHSQLPTGVATRSFARVSWHDCNQHLSILPRYHRRVVCRLYRHNLSRLHINYYTKQPSDAAAAMFFCLK